MTLQGNAIAFLTLYIVKAVFNNISRMLSKSFNQLKIIRNGLCLSLATFKPDIEKLADEHQSRITLMIKQTIGFSSLCINYELS